jgi:hypothetical protein
MYILNLVLNVPSGLIISCENPEAFMTASAATVRARARLSGKRGENKRRCHRNEL